MDSYALCPCGSGKKVKFCCQAILPEMARIEKLQENNQPRMALQAIDKLIKDHADNAWLINQRGMALIADRRHAEARDNLVAYLRKNSEHPLSNALLALSMTELEPIENCKKVIHRAFLKSMTAEPRIVAILAGKLVDHFLSSGRDMAARQHMAVVLRLESEQERQQTLLAMLEFDSDTSVPYPLRGAHPLPHYVPGDEHAANAKKAQRLYIHACYAAAADVLEQIVPHDPESAELWHTIGLMRAWDGNETQAAAALHKAASLYENADKANDVETIAQILERRQSEDNIPVLLRSYDVDSLSRLLTRLDNNDRLCRVTLMDQATMNGVTAAFDILDRAVPSTEELQNATLESIPRAIGQLTLFDATEDGTASQAHVNALQGERFDEAVRVVLDAAGDQIKPTLNTEGQPLADEKLNSYSNEELALSEAAFFPPDTPSRVRNVLRKQFIDQSVPKIWLTTPLAALGGKTPEQVAKEAPGSNALTASLRVFDSFMDRRGVMLDTVTLEKQLGIEQSENRSFKDDQDLNTLSVPQLLRLDIKSLSDDAFDRVLQRAIVVKHCGLGYRLLSEFVTSRPELVAKKTQETEQAYITLSELCSRSLKDDEALEWLQKGFKFSKEHGNAFETLLMWKMREISLRARDTDSPEFKNILLEVWNQYGSKLPAVRARLEEFIKALGVDAPWQTAIVTPDSVIGEASTWGESEDRSSAEKKLWLPD